MIGLNKEFKSPTLADWEEILKKELKSDDLKQLSFYDEIEEISVPSYEHSENSTVVSQNPGTYPFTRGSRTINNDWKIGFMIEVVDSEKANKKALDVLMKGCTELIFDLRKAENLNLKVLFDEIQFEYVNATFKLNKTVTFNEIFNHLNKEIPSNIQFSIDFIGEKVEQKLFEEILKHNSQFTFCQVNGFEIQQAGGTTWQEIAFSLYCGHEYLNRLMSAGLSIDDAAARIYFSIGIGSNYFLEIAKFRALKSVWSKIIKAYNPIHNCSYNCQIKGISGFINKSQKDPYTNLLRQTTEAMSAVSGGIDTLVIQPYDSMQSVKSTIFSERMALNVSLLLKEESYFDKVIDPLGGSYALENITSIIAKKSWVLFQEMERQGKASFSSGFTLFKISVLEKAAMRRKAFLNQSSTLIGINKYSNPEKEHFSKINPNNYMDLPQLILEQEKMKADGEI